MSSSYELSSFKYLDLCRLCLGKDRASVPIFENEQILQKIATCGLPVKILREDKLPKNICEDCEKKVEMFHQFWNTTLNAEKQLQQLVREENLKDKFFLELEDLALKAMQQDHNNSTIDDTMMHISEHENTINMDMFNNVSIITISAASEQQYTSISLDTNGTFSGLIEEEEGTQDKETAASELQQQQISEVSESTTEQTDYTVTNNRILDLALESLSLSDFNSCSESMQSPSSFLRDIASSTSYLEHISNSTCCDVPNSTFFLDQFTDSSSVSNSGFKNLPDPELIAGSELLPSSGNEFILRSIPEPELIAHTTSTAVLEVPPISSEPNPGVQDKSKRLTPKEDRSRRSRENHYCPECCRGFSDIQKLGKHMVEEHQVELPFVCDVCGRRFRSALNINRHKRIHAEMKKFACDNCDYATDQKSNLSMHIRRVHEKDYTYKCEQCGAGFMQRSKFDEHLGHHQNDNKYSCTYCRKSFKYSRNLRQHTVDHHPDKVTWPIEKKSRVGCTQCSRTFAKSQSLLRHVKAQHSAPSKKLPCEECGALLSSKSALAQHVRGHRGEKVASCEICGKKFTKWQNVRVHQRVHTGERPYKCTHCDKAFAQKTTLVHHMYTHTGQRPYKCDLCEKGFVSRSLLKKHNVKCQSTTKGEISGALKEGPSSEC